MRRPARRLGALLALAASAVLLGACAPASARESGRSLTVFAAASLTGPFNELAAAFEAGHPGVEVVLNFAGSQQLAQQLAQGAPADVFASADLNQMQAAIRAGRVAPGSPQPFVHNRLVVITPSGNPGEITGLADLARPGLKLILTAEAVPVGRYTRQFLEKAGRAPEFPDSYSLQVFENVVSYEENVKAVLSKVALGEADAGVVYASDVSGVEAGRVRQFAIPDGLNVLADYLIAPVLDAPRPELAGEFVDFVLSERGQDHLERHGFIPVR